MPAHTTLSAVRLWKISASSAPNHAAQGLAAADTSLNGRRTQASNHQTPRHTPSDPRQPDRRARFPAFPAFLLRCASRQFNQTYRLPLQHCVLKDSSLYKVQPPEWTQDVRDRLDDAIKAAAAAPEEVPDVVPDVAGKALEIFVTATKQATAIQYMRADVWSAVQRAREVCTAHHGGKKGKKST